MAVKMSETYSLHCVLAAAQFIVISLVCVFAVGRQAECVCGCVCVFVDLLPCLLEIACIDLHQTGFLGKGSGHLWLIKFWLSHAPRKGVCSGANGAKMGFH